MHHPIILNFFKIFNFLSIKCFIPTHFWTYLFPNMWKLDEKIISFQQQKCQKVGKKAFRPQFCFSSFSLFIIDRADKLTIKYFHIFYLFFLHKLKVFLGWELKFIYQKFSGIFNIYVLLFINNYYQDKLYGKYKKS